MSKVPRGVLEAQVSISTMMHHLLAIYDDISAIAMRVDRNKAALQALGNHSITGRAVRGCARSPWKSTDLAQLSVRDHRESIRIC